MDPVKNDNRCFVCGTDNPIGLKLNFSEISGGAYTELRFSHDYEGWSGIVHGGILSSVIDEAMVKAAGMTGLRCVTAELGIRYKKPCYTETGYELRGKVTAIRNRIVHTEGTIMDESGQAVVTGTGKLFIIDEI
jgi:uncharacterized protein (TIGR00369 family)